MLRRLKKQKKKWLGILSGTLLLLTSLSLSFMMCLTLRSTLLKRWEICIMLLLLECLRWVISWIRTSSSLGNLLLRKLLLKRTLLMMTMRTVLKTRTRTLIRRKPTNLKLKLSLMLIRQKRKRNGNNVRLKEKSAKRRSRSSSKKKPWLALMMISLKIRVLKKPEPLTVIWNSKCHLSMKYQRTNQSTSPRNASKWCYSKAQSTN